VQKRLVKTMSWWQDNERGSQISHQKVERQKKSRSWCRTGWSITARGEKVVKTVHKLCNMVWEEKWSEEWTKSVLVMIPKKGDLTECSTYHTSLTIERLKVVMEPHLSDEQGGFRNDRSTIQQIHMLRLIAEKYLVRGRKINNCSVWHEGLWAEWCLRN